MSDTLDTKRVNVRDIRQSGAASPNRTGIAWLRSPAPFFLDERGKTGE